MGYWWVWGHTQEGKSVISGPYADAQVADDKGQGLLEFHKVELNTRDRGVAVQRIRMDMINKGQGYDSALNRHSSKLPGQQRQQNDDISSDDLGEDDETF